MSLSWAAWTTGSHPPALPRSAPLSIYIALCDQQTVCLSKVQSCAGHRTQRQERLQAPEGQEVKCLNQGWQTRIPLVDDFSITLGVYDPQLPLLVRQRRPLHGIIPASEYALVPSTAGFCYLNKQARKPREYIRTWLGHCVYFQSSGRLRALLPSWTSTAVGRCPLQPTHARDRQPERRWQALLLAALDIFLEPWSKVGHASPQRLPQWLPATGPSAPPTVPRGAIVTVPRPVPK